MCSSDTSQLTSNPWVSLRSARHRLLRRDGTSAHVQLTDGQVVPAPHKLGFPIGVNHYHCWLQANVRRKRLSVHLHTGCKVFGRRQSELSFQRQHARCNFLRLVADNREPHVGFSL